MEDRYEIKDKIGQGGMGVVYRAFDARMNRLVAIKRIIPEGDAATQKEATDQIAKEASALASLQHPHIVTVYDVGADDEGPYVVMELLSGKTLDELVERAPLTWADFRELAMQTQEALIAAQELELVHRDIKPGNVMLTWLPSGKFQVKIVDFGLAALAPDPALQSLEDAESVLGSIFFMSPEHFERGRLDVRTDMYAMGCVYFHALTGTYPFNGDSGHAVMAAHLNHQVTPLQHLRPDLPHWVCDWVMWHINRLPEDRPEDAREALHVFFQNDKNPPPPPAPAAAEPKRPRLVIPGALEPDPPPARGPIPHPPITQTAPQPLLPPEGSKPSLHDTQTFPTAATQPEAAPTSAPSGTLLTGPSATGPALRTPSLPARALSRPKAKRGMSNGAKTALAAVLGIILTFLGYYLIQRQTQQAQAARFEALISPAANDSNPPAELAVTRADLDLLLDGAAGVQSNARLQEIYRALLIARATDETDVDAHIAGFATTRELPAATQEALIRDVLRRRGNRSALPILMGFARSTDNVRAATLSLQAARHMARDEDIGQFIEVLQLTGSPEIRSAAEEAVIEIIGKSSDRGALAKRLTSAYAGSINEPVRHALLRLMARAGGTEAAVQLRAAIESGEREERIAALTALGSWVDSSMQPYLLDSIAAATDQRSRAAAFEAAYRFLTDPSREIEPADLEIFWRTLASHARDQIEQVRVIDTLVARGPEPWVIDTIRSFTVEDQFEDRVIDRADRALGILGVSD